jgi:hypothetical protein
MLINLKMIESVCLRVLLLKEITDLEHNLVDEEDRAGRLFAIEVFKNILTKLDPKEKGNGE